MSNITMSDIDISEYNKRVRSIVEESWMDDSSAADDDVRGLEFNMSLPFIFVISRPLYIELLFNFFL